ncbi:MAG TPA: hypothetical protein ENJ93_10165 [Chloroflexi bacterium]|nr:hypothetical protein [Chloroflexota bacterium]
MTNQNRALQPATPAQQRRQYQTDLRQAQADLLEAEAELAKLQAAVNAFRMQCRLKIGRLLDEYLELRGQKQTLWTRLQLLQQAEEFGIPYDEDDPFWHGRDPADLYDDLPEDNLLPEMDNTERDRAAEKRLFRELARKFHPDLAPAGAERAYMTMMMTAVNAAYSQHNLEALRDLADELDPALVAELAEIEAVEIRRLREQILKLQRRRRRAIRRLRQLRQENMTKLWQKARELEADGRPWWEDVRQDLLKLIDRRRKEIGELETAVAQFETQATNDSRP